MDRKEKQALVSEYKDIFNSCKGFVVFDYSRINANQFSKFRANIRSIGGGVKVSKNTLAILALADTEYEGCKDIFTGPIAFAWGSDEVAPFKEAESFSKKNKELKIMGGAIGSLVLDKSGALAIAKLPNLEESRALTLGLLMSVARKFVTLTKEPASGFTRVLAQKK